MRNIWPPYTWDFCYRRVSIAVLHGIKAYNGSFLNIFITNTEVGRVIMSVTLVSASVIQNLSLGYWL